MDNNDLQTKYKISHFYIQRAKRLLPLSYFIAILVVGVQVLIFKEDSFQYLTSLLFIIFYIPNFYSGEWFFGYKDLPEPLSHYWSLGIEEQFYFVWPLVLFFILKRDINRQLQIFAMLIGVFVVAHWVPPLFGIGGQSLPTTYADLLLIGGLLCLLHRYFHFYLRFSTIHGILVLVGLFLILLFFPTEEVFFQGKYPLPMFYLYQVSLVSSIFIFSLCIGIDFPVLQFLGKISYGIYLIHNPLLIFTQEYWFGNQGIIVATILSSIGLAWISQKYFESRFYRKS